MQRRNFLQTTARCTVAAGLLGTAGVLAAKKKAVAGASVWQIDPEKCIGCGACAYRCVNTVSAVKCFHNFKMCGYCDLCTGFFDPQPLARNAGAENQLCPTNAISRRDVETPYFEYQIDKELCIGCGKCVDGCFSLGNGSLFLQIDQSRCKQCNQCAIALYCPSKAIQKISAEQGYLFKATES
ncbi:MAG: 4Fe-4S binding protein [Planctomycetaceae bacterium]|jgi:electron transport complex protein RnfB|nr:4Fe-4S binding protein [Planctomycetaceae bacterium]